MSTRVNDDLNRGNFLSMSGEPHFDQLVVAEEVLRDIQLLSRCDYLVHTASAVAEAAIYTSKDGPARRFARASFIRSLRAHQFARAIIIRGLRWQYTAGNRHRRHCRLLLGRRALLLRLCEGLQLSGLSLLLGRAGLFL